MKTVHAACLFAMALLPLSAFADTQCGPFRIGTGFNDGWMRINNQKPETQKLTFLKQKDDYNNVMMQWMLPDPKVGRWLGLDYVKQNNKAILNVEVVRTNMNQPREFWSYDCVKVK